jgi:signal transduction histidine kinase/CheY-like chemotaxis protein
LPVAIAVVLVTVAVFAPIFLFGALVRQTVDRDIVARSAAERLVTARMAAGSIDRELGSVAEDLEIFAGSTAVRAALRAGARPALDGVLIELLREYPGSLGAIFDRSGIAVSAPLARDLVGQDFSFRDYFRGALASPGSYVSEIFASASSGNPSVVGVSHRIADGADTLGVVVLTISPADLLELLAPLRQVEGRDLLILDRSARVVAATDPAYRPLATIAAPSPDDPSTEPVEIAGQERIVTAGSIGFARWTLYVIDDPSLVLMGQRKLSQQLRGGSAGVAVVALVAAGALAFFYAKTIRQRSELVASRAHLAKVNLALEEASRHKTDFLANMSHELRTPLNAILGFSDLLVEQLEASLTARQRRYLANIGEAGRHLLGLINDVLDLSKVEAGRIELRPEVLSLEAAVAPSISSTRVAADAAGLRFDTLLPADVTLAVDPGRLRQILYNLLSNAVKFTKPGGRVELAMRSDGTALDIAVSDTGIGIPADKRDRVFATFERLHEGRSEATGTGLGLALTKRLVELHRGSIDFASHESTGTVFRVRLPEVVVPAHGGERVLIVEDETRDADLMLALVARSGLEGEVAGSVAAATVAIRRATPLAVVLDLRLGDERGERVIEILRSDRATSGVPVIVVTVEDDDGQARRLGADDHITKPIDHERLARWLEKVAARIPSGEVSVADPAGG